MFFGSIVRVRHLLLKFSKKGHFASPQSDLFIYIFLYKFPMCKEKNEKPMNVKLLNNVSGSRGIYYPQRI